MARKPFNATFHFYRGPSVGPLGPPWLLTSGRLVEMSYRTVRPYPFDSLVGYVSTAVGPNFNGASISARTLTPGLNWGFADLVSAPGGGPPEYTVVMIDRIQKPLFPPYIRLWVVSYPFPT